MITIKINEQERSLQDIDEQWLNQQINRRRDGGEVVCVRVTIQQGPLDMILSTPACQSSGGFSRPANPQECAVNELWNQRGLNRADFTSGNLIAFLKQLDRRF